MERDSLLLIDRSLQYDTPKELANESMHIQLRGVQQFPPIAYEIFQQRLPVCIAMIHSVILYHLNKIYKNRKVVHQNTATTIKEITCIHKLFNKL